MFNSRLKIASVSAEVDPYSKTGGLADVARSLPKALKRLGHDVIIITPFYHGKIDVKKHKLEKVMEDISVIIDNKHKEKINVWRGYIMEDLPVYFIENEKYFSPDKKLYGYAGYNNFPENEKFVLFDLAVLKVLVKLKFKANIIQCHDWNTGLIPYYLKNDFKNSEILKKTATVYTIHNLVYQLGKDWWSIPKKERDNGRSNIPDLNDPRLENINFAKRAILNADTINAVSEQYAKEIMERENGQDLHWALRKRKNDVFGVVNGIDYKDYNPKKDPGLIRNFDYYSINLKAENKRHLQKMFKLPQEKDIPLVVMVTRVIEQKGFDLIKDIADVIFRLNIQMVVVGNGEEKYMNKLKELAKKYPKKFNASFKWLPSKDTTKIYAGSDMLLMPSRFEPCGVMQMIAMRYGSIPIVRHVGGLIDTVDEYQPKYKTGNGFIFEKYDSRDMVIAITRAIEAYRREDEWKALVEKVMRKSYSWEYPARKYSDLFKETLKRKEKKDKENKK